MHAATLSVTQPRLLCMRRRRRFCAGFVWMPSCLAGDSHCIGFASTRRGVLFILVQNLAFPFFFRAVGPIAAELVFYRTP